MRAGEDAERECDSKGDDHAAQHQLQRGRDPVGEQRRDRLPRPEGDAEIALGDLAEPERVLVDDRLVEAVLRLEARDEVRVRLDAEHRGDGVAGDDPDVGEDEDGQPEQQWDREEHPVDRVAEHGRPNPLGGDLPPPMHRPRRGLVVRPGSLVEATVVASTCDIAMTLLRHRYGSRVVLIRPHFV